MDVSLLIARIGLAAIFVLAAVAKLADRRGMRATLVAFGLPPALAAPGAITLPVVELTIAVLLLPTLTARWGALAAAATLVVFSAAIARSLARGEQPDCSCFGQLHSAPVGPAALFRNLALAGVAVAVAAAGPGRSLSIALAGVDGLAAVAVAALVAILAVQSWFGYHLFRQNGRLLERIRALEKRRGEPQHGREHPGLPESTQAPEFELPDIAGRRRSLEQLLAGGVPVALAFLDPDCGACTPLLPRLAQLRSERAGELELAIVTRGGQAETRARINGYEFDTVLLQDEHEVADAFRIQRVPSAVLVAPDGRFASPVAVGPSAIEELLGGHPTLQMHMSGAAD
jgi:uncharacterized membrane protein YphA (DoxX/SURF4 family)